MASALRCDSCNAFNFVFMLYMVIERFKEGAAPEIYRRLRTNDLMDFEIVPVRTSADAVERMSAKL